MSIFTYHLAECGVATTLRFLARPPSEGTVRGLMHAECMIPMTLGKPVALPTRYRPHQLAVFARWTSEAALDAFLTNSPLGATLAGGWHVRMEFLRRWGYISQFHDLPAVSGEYDEQRPVVAVTLARLKLSQAIRFIRWGKPVEEQVRDDSATTLALAAMRPLRTLSTFSIWTSQKGMTDMVNGRSDSLFANRHAHAMQERCRKDFHHEFTTLRFRPVSEHGVWQGKSRYLP